MTSFPIPIFTLNMKLDSQCASGSLCPHLISLCLLIGVPSAHVCLINRSGLNLISLLFKFLLDLKYASHICKNFNIFLLLFFMWEFVHSISVWNLFLESLSYTLTGEGLESDSLNSQNNARTFRATYQHRPALNFWQPSCLRLSHAGTQLSFLTKKLSNIILYWKYLVLCTCLPFIHHSLFSELASEIIIFGHIF